MTATPAEIAALRAAAAAAAEPEIPREDAEFLDRCRWQAIGDGTLPAGEPSEEAMAEGEAIWAARVAEHQQLFGEAA